MKQKLIWILIIIIVLGVSAGRTQAQDDDLAWSATAVYDFGQSFRFQLTATSSAPIRQATLFLSAPELARTYRVTKPIEPAMEVTLSQNVDLTRVRLAPFTTVTYWWVLQTEAEMIELPPQTVEYEDDQFTWQTLVRDGVSVHWTGDDPGLGQLALDIVAESLPRLTALIPAADPLPLEVFVYPSAADLRTALRLTGRDWVGAHAHPELGVVLVTAVNARTAATDLRQSIPHELVHHLLYRAAGPNYDALPVWFNEGMATAAEATANPGYNLILERAVAAENVIPFIDLCGRFPEVEDRALLAYAQSASLVEYIRRQYGALALTELANAFGAGADCEAGIVQVLERPLSELERDWLRRQQPQPTWRQFLAQNGVWLLFLLGGFGIMSLLIIQPGKRT